MQLIRRHENWDPFREMEELSNRMNRFFGLARQADSPLPRFLSNEERESLATTDWMPSCDISESDNEYHIQAELPKVRKENVHVTLEDGVLTIQGERQAEREVKGVKLHRRELSYGTFLRRFTMPDDADEAKVEASFRDGMLEVVIAKAKAKANKSKEIAVH